MGSQNSSGLVGSLVQTFSPIRSSSGGRFPECPYMKGYRCGVFDFRFRSSVCCCYSNSSQESYDDDSVVSVYRCCWLPSSVKNGFHEAKFYSGVLHGEGVSRF